MYRLSIGGVIVWVDYIIGVKGSSKDNLICSYFARSEMAVRNVGANLDLRVADILKETGQREEVLSPMLNSESYCCKIYSGKEHFYHGVSVSKAVNHRYIITKKESYLNDVYSFLMKQFNLPLLKEWIPFLLQTDEMIKQCETYKIGNVDCFDELLIFQVMGNEQLLEEMITDGLQSKRIKISNTLQKKLQFNNIDDYFQKYGFSILSNLKSSLNPLQTDTSLIEYLAFFNKRLFPKQANVVNGAIHLLEKKKNYCIVNQGMGSGKTLQSLAIMEGYFNKKYLKLHPKETVKDLYMEKGKIHYRNILMVPAHLISKWAETIKEELPYAEVKVISCLQDLIHIKENGKERTGKEFYIVSKDTSKLAYSMYPIPTQIKMKEVKQYVCNQCGEPKPLGMDQCKCGNKTWILIDMNYMEKGLICPDCGELLYPSNIKRLKLDGNVENRTYPLLPQDFSSRTTANIECRLCGCKLWAPDCSLIGSIKKKKWKKVSHYTNMAKKGRKTSWILNDDFTAIKVKEGIEEVENNSNRRYSLALYIKKYLKGFFDFALFDECHKCKSGTSAQGIAMHQLIKASKKQLALTGTIAGGYATDLFYLLYRLDPAMMIKEGYEYGSKGELKFAADFGTIETCYEANKKEEVYNSTSKGRIKASPKCRPGISPLIYSKFLLENAIFLDLSDMNEQLPPLREKLITVPLENEIAIEYERVRRQLKAIIQKKEGKRLLGEYLQFCLSYTDKPYGRSKILSPTDGSVVALPADIYKKDLMNKEKELVQVVNQELDENRNLFIYCEFTGKAETNITNRLKNILMKHCVLKEHEVCILESGHPVAQKREDWIHKKAEEGAKVIITNPRCTETGIDFCFEYNKKLYNYPTIINYQLGYSLFVVMQSCYRHYRLNQIEECRTYYLVSENTIQLEVVDLIARKQAATQVLQGTFSSEGLAAMASGVDTRIALAQACIEEGEKQKEKIKALKLKFEQMNQAKRNMKKESVQLMKTFYELTGIDRVKDIYHMDTKNEEFLGILFPEIFGTYEEQESLDSDSMEIGSTETVWLPKRKGKKKKNMTQQYSLLDF